MSTDVKVLGQEKKDSYSGDVILNSQTMATAQGFSHVSKPWYDQCISMDKALERMANEQQKIQDFESSPLTEWCGKVTDAGDFVFEHKSGQQFRPTETAMVNLGVMSGLSTWMLKELQTPKMHATKKDKQTKEPVKLYDRDERDAGLIKHMFDITLFAPDRTDQTKPRLWRTWNDGTLRAVLSDQYVIVNNMWVLEAFKKIVPGGLFSHFERTDADNLRGNILIPDTIRAERDSDYGGGLSVGNSEIGLRTVSSLPWVFRAICMNGCIWDQEKGKKIRVVHKGSLQLDALFTMIKENLEAQIPLLNSGIERTLGIRAYGNADTPILNMFAETAETWKINPKNIQGVLKAYSEEVNILKEEAKTAFGLAASVTRYGQTLDNTGWEVYDRIGGEFANMSPDNWANFVKRAKSLDGDRVNELLGLSA